MYQVKNYDSLLGLTGFSDQAMNTHFALYKGYVDNTNKLLETRDNPESRRRLGWEFNGMRL
ncbi:MAG: superoxide dismutase, partial [Parcubacteria group bacterium CG23_combo_of_CG06-09_8_20_14_all_35_6]